MEIEQRIIGSFVERALGTAVRRTIRTLQGLKDDLPSGDDSGLANTWDEICVQIQFEESFYWEFYEETIRSILLGFLEALPRHELEAAWLLTVPGIEWLSENEEVDSPTPLVVDDVLEDALQVLYARAGEWSNQRIRDYIDRPRSD